MINRGIPQDIANDPDAIIQKMMQEGKISQQQYNSARQAAGRIQSNPMFAQMLGGIKKV
jgi:replicative DNA helicase